NGAGKSTLLKILSGITSPTAGKVRLRGRRLSILDIGTGFHPDLSGRENIYLNGALNGLSRAEMEQRVPDIIEFSEIADFIDVPVKTYSNGMYLRLAFSIMIHLDADILLLDEVLAVGDAGFQLKCMHKIRELAQADQTFVLVSHSMSEMIAVCTRVMRLEDGKIVDIGSPMEVVGEYMNSSTEVMQQMMSARDFDADSPENRYVFSAKDQEQHPILKYHELVVHGTGKAEDADIDIGDGVTIKITLDITAENKGTGLIMQLNNQYNNKIAAITPTLLRPSDPFLDMSQPGRYTFQCQIPPHTLKNGYYNLDIGMQSGSDFMLAWPAIVRFQVGIPDLKPENAWFKHAPVMLGPAFGWEVEFGGEHRSYPFSG
ncbi:MAG: ATP-binding cassette domain-containing protein, partial [Bacteroidota bacterium]